MVWHLGTVLKLRSRAEGDVTDGSVRRQSKNLNAPNILKV